MNNIEKKYENVAVVRGGVFLLDKVNAMAFIADCEIEAVAILGIDGFYLTEESTQPSMEDSIDFSSSNLLSMEVNKFDYAIRFVKSRNDNMYFEIVCAD